MKRLLLFILLFVVSLSAYPQIKNHTQLNGPYGGSISTIIVNGKGELLASGYSDAGGGVFKSTDAGVTWTNSSSGIAESVIDMFKDPSSNKLYVLTYQSIYLSTDDGSTWTALNTSIGNITQPFAVAKGVQYLYYMDYNGTVFRSMDGGTTWGTVFTVDVVSGGGVQDFVIDNTGVMYIATYGNGLYVADESGNYVQKLPAVIHTDVHVVGSDVWALGYDGPYKSTDHGVTWTLTKTGMTSTGPGQFRSDASNNLYAFQNGSVWKSTNAGANWSALPSPGYFAFRFGAWVISPTSYLIAVDNVGVYKTANSGTTWGLASSGINLFGEPRLFSYDTRLFYTIPGGGYYTSANDGQSWTLVRSGAAQRQVLGFTKIGSTYYGFGSGLMKSTDLSTWTDVNSGIDMPFTDALVSSNGTTMYTYGDRNDNKANITLYTSTNGGTSFTQTVLTGLPVSQTRPAVRNGNWILNNAGNTIYFAYQYNDAGTSTTGLYKVNPTNGAATQVTTFPGTTQNGLRDIKYVNGKLYVVKTDYYVYMSADEAATWTQLGKLDSFDDQIRVINDNLLFELNTKLKKSKDGGVTWGISDTFGSIVKDVAVNATGTLFVAPAASSIYKGKVSVFPPPAPTVLKATGFSHNRVGIQWNDNASNEQYYVVERKNTSASTYDSIGQVFVSVPTGTNYIGNYSSQGLAPQTAYNYRVRAVSGGGSSYSNEITVTTLADCSATSAIPDNRSWTGTTTNQSGIGVKTNNLVAITSSSITKGVYSISNLNVGAATGVHAEPAVANIVENCGTVFMYSGTYDVSNGNGTWNSGTKTLTIKWRTGLNISNTNYREETTVFTLNATDPVPAKPAKPTVYSMTATSAQVSWVAVNFVTQYIIQRSLQAATGFAEVGRVAYNKLTYNDPGLTTGTTYYYRVIALNGTGQSAASDAVGVPVSEPSFDRIELTPGFAPNVSVFGSAWADLDGDSFEDLVVTPTNITTMVFRNKGNKTFEQITPAGVALPLTGSGGIATGDYNNDGKIDLLLNQKNITLWTNKGSMTFEGSTVDATITPNTPGFVDFNLDGLLDISATQGYNGVPVLFKQASDNSYTKYNDDAVNAISYAAISSSWADYDNDGDQDFYVENYDGLFPNRLLNNDGTGKFNLTTNPAFSAPALVPSESSSWGDYDNDGDLDLFQGSETNNDILYRNKGDGTFERVTTLLSESFTGAGIQYTNGSAWGDVDNDGDLDILVTRTPNNTLYLNDGAGNFTKHTVAESINSNQVYDNSAAFSDFDQDGYLDLFIQRQLTEPLAVFRNKRTGNKWIELKLIGTISNKSAIGARVTITLPGNKKQIREVLPITGYFSQNSYVVHFGLGAATTVPTVTIHWPSGIEQTLENVNSNQLLTVTEVLPPPILSSPTVQATITKGVAPTTWSVKVQNTFGDLTGGKLMYRGISGGDFKELNGSLNIATGSYDFAVTEAMFDAQGLEYYFKATNSNNKEGRLPAGTATLTSYVQYTGDNTRIPPSALGFGGAKTNWKVFTIPFDLGTASNVSTVMNELAGKDATKDWRLITYGTPDDWSEYPSGFQTFDRGKGYFINIRTEIVISIADNLTAPTHTLANLFKTTLKKGWNQVGNPYLTPIQWTNVATYNGLSGTAATMKKFSGGSYSNADQLAPFEGGFVFVDNDTQISIPFAGQNGPPSRLAADDFNDGTNWKVDLSLSQDAITSSFSGIGMHKDASESMDRFDDINPPRFMDYTEINFAHPEHFAKRFALDVVEVQSSHVWTFTVDTNSGDDVQMTWNNKSIANSDRQLYLFDVNTQAIVDMRKENGYSFSPTTSANFRIYYGDKPGSVQLPDAHLLRDPSPNPSRDKATVQFLLPEMAGDYSVSLDVYDLLGRKVTTLEKGILKPGLYSREWSALEQADGTYMVRLIVNGKSETKKLMIRK